MADEPLVADPALDAALDNSDSDYDPNDWQSIPSDDEMFDSYEAGHLLALVMDSDDRENPFFRSPIGSSPQRILDIGTGKGTWAIDVADMFPSAIVRGVDLFPPPASWMPPNCILEVDDVLQEWTWHEQFDLIHMRIMISSFEPQEWDRVYKQCYDNLRPGGWIEQLEASPVINCDDGSLPLDNVLNEWGPSMMGCGERCGRPCDILDTMPARIRNAGFVDVHEKVYKWPIGPWAKNRQYKEAGAINLEHWMRGLEGWCMWLLTKFGAPEPWSLEKVQAFVAQIRNELKNPRFHIYQNASVPQIPP
ncbi:hypothetical protein N7510_008092 [Penicillium lagena]|uniref:uncharacterized protein n=1 Tax=Penicillium lagena TaxID=94218 RepID=UPI0025420955|nr:uncharacterized protein N7510_008092 [Penicillium lagena]KAJ5611373.1 hypothetical protein N7510_008092 [Penicillium lagena]